MINELFDDALAPTEEELAEIAEEEEEEPELPFFAKFDGRIPDIFYGLELVSESKNFTFRNSRDARYNQNNLILERSIVKGVPEKYLVIMPIEESTLLVYLAERLGRKKQIPYTPLVKESK